MFSVPDDEWPTYRAESYFPLGTLRRIFWLRKVRWTFPFSSVGAFSSGNIANCLPSGGPPGYQNFLEAVRNPGHEEHEAMLEWVGGSFDAVHLMLQR